MITALYQDNQLVGVVTTSINEKQNVVVGVPYNSLPNTAKVMVWGNLINIKPIEGAATYTSASPEWKTNKQLMRTVPQMRDGFFKKYEKNTLQIKINMI